MQVSVSYRQLIIALYRDLQGRPLGDPVPLHLGGLSAPWPPQAIHCLLPRELRRIVRRQPVFERFGTGLFCDGFPCSGRVRSTVAHTGLDFSRHAGGGLVTRGFAQQCPIVSPRLAADCAIATQMGQGICPNLGQRHEILWAGHG